MSKILLIEDESVNQKVVRLTLSHHEISVCDTFAAARKYLNEIEFSLILLDVGLPDGDGFNFLIEIKSFDLNKEVPVILLTGRNQSADKVTGYSLGADDYITKPIDPLVFRALVDGKLKKTGETRSEFRKSGFDISMDRQTASFELENKLVQVELSSLEFKLLLYLLKHKDHVLSREQLINDVWGEQVAVSDRTVDSHISRLRKSIAASKLTITSVYGSGYKLTDKVLKAA